MKRYFLLSALALIVLFLTQCRKPNEYHLFTDFPVTVELSHKPINIESPILYPSGMVFLDSALVVLDISGDYFLSFFTLDDFDLRNRSIRRGRGPSEEVSVFFISNAMEENKFWYRTHSGIKTVKYQPGKDELIPVGFSPNCDAFSGLTFPLDDDLLGFSQNAQSSEFVKISTDDCAIVDFGPNFPNVGRELSINEKDYLLGTKSLSIRPDGELFAVLYHYFPILRIFNSNNGSLKREVRFNNNQDFPYSAIDVNATPEEKMSTTTNYFVSHATNRFIYASYAGRSLLEIQPNIIRDGFKITDFTNEIHVFDWEGNPVKRIVLDKSIFAFAVSPDDKTLVAIPMSDPSVLLKYDLSSILN